MNPLGWYVLGLVTAPFLLVGGLVAWFLCLELWSRNRARRRR